MVIKNLENKIKLVTIFCGFFLAGCVLISLSSIWTARMMVTDAQQKVYVLDGNVPILVQRTTMEETLDVEAKKGQTGKQKSKWFPTNRKQLRHLKRLKSGSMKHMMTSI
mgnify:CR=1 FL=1